MTNKQKYEIIKIIATAIISIAGTMFVQSCVTTINNVTRSENVKIKGEQSLQQKNDSTNFNMKVK